MITFTQHVSTKLEAQHTVALPYHQRVKGRLRVITNAGIDVGILIERGGLLNHGDKLSDGNGNILEVHARAESVSVASTKDALLLSKACYHVGNRHAEVQIESDRIIYLNDPVLDDMLSQLGLLVTQGVLPFSPENGAYSKTSNHSHSHDSHRHSHEH